MRNIMKFILKNIEGGSGRLAVIEDVGNLKKTVETPMCLLYTRGGAAPHLTRDMLYKIHNLPPVAHVAVSMLAEHHEAIQEYGKGIAKFAGMEDFIVYASLHDTSIEVPAGYNDKTGIAVWTKGGKLKLDVEQFLKVQTSLQVDWCQSLSDQDTHAESSRKRTVKAVDRTLTFLDDILEKKSKSASLQKMEVFGVVEGGYLAAERERSAKETSVRQVAGFVIEGFHSFGAESEKFQLKNIEELLKITLENLPEDKPRLMHAVWPPDRILEAVQAGIDIFDSCYPYMVTERGGALTFTFNYKLHGHPDSGDSTPPLPGFELSLKDKVFFDDFSPIVQGCSCYTCRTFTRAYINHLLVTSELLAGVLLMIHNFHHYFKFFQTLRQALADNQLTSLKHLIEKQKR